MLAANTTTSVATPALDMRVSNTLVTSPTNNQMINDTSESFGTTISFGTLGLVVSAIGVAVAILQLRRMSHRTRTAEVFELACKSKYIESQDVTLTGV